MTNLSDDVLVGAEAIAVFLWGDSKKKRRVYYLAERGEIPVFWLGDLMHARRSTLIEDISRREREAVAKGAAA